MGLFQSDNTRNVKKLKILADKVLQYEDEYKQKTDAQLRAMTDIFKQRLVDGEKLDNLLPEAFATVREAASRVLGQLPFYVQILGGVALHQGRIAEMKTGEGKTLTCTMPAYLNALTGKGVHIVEANEYLAKRNTEWMGKVHRFLGLTVRFSRAHSEHAEKKKAYDADITYVTSSEVGFDYLRDNVARHKNDRVLRGHHFAIVDEADSILIDESRTPLIMSMPTKDNSDLYRVCDRFARGLREGDYEVDLKERAVRMTEDGIEKAERQFGIENISDAAHMELNHFINNALRAHLLFEIDSDYIVNKDKEVVIIDQNTGRMMVGRRYSDGLHQAIEAKEGVPIKNEDKTVATVTIQNLFKIYPKLSGMTGTAKTEEREFQKIYGIDVVSIPTNKDVQREDAPDVVFQTMEGKMAAILEDVLYCHERGQPVLIGTTTIEKSEEISKYLKKEKIKHVVLNAKNHEQEADIVAQAGKKGSITIATNMAGRGTDILLGGNPEYLATKQLKKEGYDDEQIYDITGVHDIEDAQILKLREYYKEIYKEFKQETDAEKKEVVELGGLHIIGTERHDSRRIDNQLRGRSGRQGDPGSSIFYICLEDDIMKRFGKSIVGGMMKMLKLDNVQHRMMTKMFEKVQKAVEGHYFDARRYTFEYDNVLNAQRELIYKERNQILDGEDVHKQILNMFPEVVSKVVAQAIDTEKNWREWDLERANKVLGQQLFGKEVNYLDADNTESADYTDVEQMVLDAVTTQYQAKVDKLKAEDGLDFSEMERSVLLQVVDNKWMDHIDAMVNLRNGIGLRGYGQKDPLIEYRREAIGMFNEIVESINERACIFLFRIQLEKRPVKETPFRNTQLVTGRGQEVGSGNPDQSQPEARAQRPQGTYTKESKKEVGRNDPCPCKSGKKFKACCGTES
ncbi:MAG: preprotein translocase subunit SecA [Firmicutes bacterium]|nr:preprotein translocase subunit SecA [Bacillota bacterium]